MSLGGGKTEHQLSGIGLREEHFADIVNGDARTFWLEWLIDNYLFRDSTVYDSLGKIREQHQVAFHSVGLNLGSIDPLDRSYLKRLKELADWFEPFIVSDHLAFVCWEGRHHHDLMPVVYNEATLHSICSRISQIQDSLARPILVENPTNYIHYQESTFSESAFLKEMAAISGCGLLLDLNNVYVNGLNHLQDPRLYLKELQGAPIGQLHLAGHLPTTNGVVDTHGAAIIEPLWQLFSEFITSHGPVPTLIEWDQNIPVLSELLDEARKAQDHLMKAPLRTDESACYDQFPMQKNPGPLPQFWQQAQSDLSKAVLDLKPQSDFPPSKNCDGMEIYQRNLIMTVRKTLIQDLPTTREALSSDNFDFFCREYAKTQAATSGPIDNIASGFPDFIRNHPLTKEEKWLHQICYSEAGTPNF